jgi:hypothetical protein
MLAMFLVASPAQAAVSVDLNVDDTTITLGDSITLSWTSTEATTLQASGDSIWNGTKSTASGTQTEVVTPTTTGDHTYTLTATDVNGRESADSVTVTVAPGPITPNAVTFPDPCTVVIPTTPNVTYFVDFGDGDIQELDADTYDGGELSFGDEVTLFAEANDGFTLADGATTEWPYTAPDSCFDIDEGPDLVTTSVDCGSVTFTNTTDGPLDVEFVALLEEEYAQLDQFTLAAGASRTVKTSEVDNAFGVFTDFENDQDDPLQVRYVEVPQNCDGGSDNGNGDGSDHPTTAPAAGITAR